MFTILYK